MHAIRLMLVSALCAVLASPAFADNDKNKGKGNDNKGNDNRGNDRGAVIQTPTRVVVTDRDRTTVYTYYRTEFVRGDCPPGLAKKNNGCLPPGQANKLWTVGRPLPSTVVYYPLPPPLLVQLAPVPMGYEYVRVENDIVMLALGTRMVVEAITDLSRLQD